MLQQMLIGFVLSFTYFIEPISPTTTGMFSGVGRGGGDGGGPPRAAAKLRLYQKFRKSRSILRGRNFRKELQKSRRCAKN